jgi:hypothetical protein
MRVVIKDVYGHKEVMDIEPEWTVGHLKNRIEMARGIPVMNQRLIYLGSPLENEMTLERVEEGSVIWVVRQMS